MSISRPRRPGYRTAIAAVVPAVAATFLFGSAAPASAGVSPVAPQGSWNWGDCHIVNGGFLNANRWGYGDTTVTCSRAHSMSITTYLVRNGSTIRTGSRNVWTTFSGDVLTTPGVCGSGNATWQTVSSVSIDNWGRYTLRGPVGGAYAQGACP
jgi:hypothetical protein